MAPSENGAPKQSAGSSSDPPSGAVRLPRNLHCYQSADAERKGGRTIVVCLDGTGDKFDNDNSNIVHLVSALKKDDKEQVTYYQAGIGTYGNTSKFASAMDMAVGSQLGLHVRDAYQFLMHAYKEGDRICIFGFSRGAYTARCLAGMVHKIGLLPPQNVQQIEFAYDYYKDDTPEGWKKSAQFKKVFSINVSVYFVGVFDSVASVGIIPRVLPLSSTPTNKARYFRHAVSLDERRAKFKPALFEAKDFSDVKDASKSSYSNEDLSKERDETAKKKAAFESIYVAEEKPFESDVSEVWFAGVHADVGGGAVADKERHKLSAITLRWMVRQCFECNTGIIFKTRHLAEMGLDVHKLWPKYVPLQVPTSGPTDIMRAEYKKGLPSKHERAHHLEPVDHTPHGGGHWDLKIHELEADEGNPSWIPEQMEDWFDAMSPLNDQLEVAKGWWILELWPVQYKEQKAESDEWVVKTGMNLGRYRGIVHDEPQMHWTVKARSDESDYKVQARYGRNATWKVVA